MVVSLLKGLGISTPVVHSDWEALVRAFHGVGLLDQLTVSSLPLRLGERAALPPDDEGRAALLDDYFRGDGFGDAALARTRQDGYVAYREGELSTATTMLAGFRRAVPELGRVDLLDAPEGLAVGVSDLVVPIADAGVFTYSTPLGVSRQSLVLMELVRALNRILHLRGRDRRILPLAGVDGVEAYLALRREQSLSLDEVGAFDGSLAELSGLAFFRPASGVVRRAERPDVGAPALARGSRWRALLRVA